MNSATATQDAPLKVVSSTTQWQQIFTPILAALILFGIYLLFRTPNTQHVSRGLVLHAIRGISQPF